VLIKEEGKEQEISKPEDEKHAHSPEE